MHIAQFVDRVNGQYHFRCIKFDHVFGEPVFKFTEQCKDITSKIVIHHKILKDYNVSKALKNEERRRESAKI